MNVAPQQRGTLMYVCSRSKAVSRVEKASAGTHQVVSCQPRAPLASHGKILKERYHPSVVNIGFLSEQRIVLV